MGDKADYNNDLFKQLKMPDNKLKPITIKLNKHTTLLSNGTKNKTKTRKKPMVLVEINPKLPENKPKLIIKLLKKADGIINRMVKNLDVLLKKQLLQRNKPRKKPKKQQNWHTIKPENQVDTSKSRSAILNVQFMKRVVLNLSGFYFPLLVYPIKVYLKK